MNRAEHNTFGRYAILIMVPILLASVLLVVAFVVTN